MNNIKVEAWTSFGITAYATKDSVSGMYYFAKPIGRLRVTGTDIEALDTIFRNEIPIGSILVFQLKVTAMILDEAVISVSRSESRLKDATVSLTIIKPYIIENKISTDLGQVLNQVPGVNVADNQINIRNGNGWSYGVGSRVMVLVDDLPMLSGDAQAAQLSFIPLENIESVEIVKSAGSVLYGSSALNGIVNVRSAEPTPVPQLKLSTFSGFFDHPGKESLKWSQSTRYVTGSSGYFSQAIKNTGIIISYNLLDNQGFRMNEFDRRARIRLKLNFKSSGIPGLSYGTAAAIQTGKSGSFLLWESYKQGYIPLDSGFNFSNSQKMSLDPFVKFKGKRFSHMLLSRVLYLNNDNENGNPKNDQSNSSSFIYSEYRISRWLLNNQLLVTGGAVSSFTATQSPLFTGSQTARNLSVFFQANIKLNRLKIQAGGRYENYKLNQFVQSKPVIRTGLNYALSKITYLRASWGQGYRFPSIAESFISTSAGPVQVYPNPELKPETGNSSEIGIKQGYRIGKFNGYIDVAAFRTAFHNLMEFTFSQWADFSAPLVGLGFKSVNTGKVKISGFEIESVGRGRIHKYDILLIGGYTYTIPLSIFPDSTFALNYFNYPLTYSNTRADSNNFLKYRFKHLFRADIQISRGKWEIGIGTRVTSPMLNMDEAFVSLISPDIRIAWKSLGTSKIFDIRAGYKLKSSMKLNFQILNFTNTVYMNRPADLGPPRSYQLQLVWQP